MALEPLRTLRRPTVLGQLAVPTPQEQAQDERLDREIASLRRSETEKAFHKGGLQLRSSVEGAKGAVNALIGRDEASLRNVTRADALGQQAQTEGPEIDTFEEGRQSVGNFARYAANTFVSQVPNLAVLAATGLAGRFGGGAIAGLVRGAQATAKGARVGTAAGAVAGGTALETGGQFPGLVGDKESDFSLRKKAGTALAGGAISGSLDAFPVFRVFDKFGVGKSARRAVNKSLRRRLSEETLKGAGAEGLTEAAQTVVNRATRKFANENYEIFSDEGLKEILEASVAGAIVGGPFGAIGGIPGGARLDAPPSAKDTLDERIADLEADDELQAVRGQTAEQFERDGLRTPDDDVYRIAAKYINPDNDNSLADLTRYRAEVVPLLNALVTGEQAFNDPNVQQLLAENFERPDVMLDEIAKRTGSPPIFELQTLMAAVEAGELALGDSLEGSTVGERMRLLEEALPDFDETDQTALTQAGRTQSTGDSDDGSKRKTTGEAGPEFAATNPDKPVTPRLLRETVVPGARLRAERKRLEDNLNQAREAYRKEQDPAERAFLEDYGKRRKVEITALDEKLKKVASAKPQESLTKTRMFVAGSAVRTTGETFEEGAAHKRVRELDAGELGKHEVVDGLTAAQQEAEELGFTASQDVDQYLQTRASELAQKHPKLVVDPAIVVDPGNTDYKKFLKNFEAVQTTPASEIFGEGSAEARAQIDDQLLQRAVKPKSDPKKPLPRGNFQIRDNGVVRNVNAHDLINAGRQSMSLGEDASSPARLYDLLKLGLKSLLAKDGVELLGPKEKVNRGGKQVEVTTLPDDLVAFSKKSKAGLREFTFGELRKLGAAKTKVRGKQITAKLDELYKDPKQGAAVKVSVQRFEGLVKDRERMGTKAVMVGDMNFAYEDQKRPGIKSANTLDAIKAGERTATTRWGAEAAKWKNVKLGDRILWRSRKGAAVEVEVTRAPYKVGHNPSVAALGRWSKLEGWSTEHGAQQFASRGEGIQFTYKFIRTVNPNLYALGNTKKAIQALKDKGPTHAQAVVLAEERLRARRTYAYEKGQEQAYGKGDKDKDFAQQQADAQRQKDEAHLADFPVEGRRVDPTHNKFAPGRQSLQERIKTIPRVINEDDTSGVSFVSEPNKTARLIDREDVKKRGQRLDKRGNVVQYERDTARRAAAIDADQTPQAKAQRRTDQKLTDKWLKHMGLGDLKVRIIDAAEAAKVISAENAERIGTLRGFTKPVGDEIVIFIDPRVKGPARLATLAHEVGHVLMNNAAVALRRPHAKALKDAFDTWRQQFGRSATLEDVLLSRKPFHTLVDMKQQRDQGLTSLSSLPQAEQDYLLDFDEWFADNAAKWLLTDAKPRGIIEEFFHYVAQVIRDLFEAVKHDVPDQSVTEFLDSMFRAAPQRVEKDLFGAAAQFERASENRDLVRENQRQANGQQLVNDLAKKLNLPNIKVVNQSEALTYFKKAIPLHTRILGGAGTRKVYRDVKTRITNRAIQGVRFTAMSLSEASPVIYVDTQLRDEVYASTLLHEFGHHIELTALEQATTETKAAIQKQYEAWRLEQTKNDVRLRYVAQSRMLYWNALAYSNEAKKISEADEKTLEYMLSFVEWFADQVSRWAVTDQKAQTLVEKFFEKLVMTFKGFFKHVENDVPASSVKDFMEQLARDARSAPQADPRIQFERDPEDRRTDAKTRKRIDQMAPDEMRQELLIDELTGLGNRRAYGEAPRKKVQASLDADGLKWINDNLGHESGDKLLAAIGQALREATGDAYHVSGDEFVAQFDTDAQANEVLSKVRERLRNAVIEVTLPDGTKITKTGADFSYGLGATLDAAETKLQIDKTGRTQAGLRAGRGETPPGVVRTVAQGGQGNQGDAAAKEAGIAPPNQPPEPPSGGGSQGPPDFPDDLLTAAQALITRTTGIKPTLVNRKGKHDRTVHYDAARKVIWMATIADDNTFGQAANQALRAGFDILLNPHEKGILERAFTRSATMRKLRELVADDPQALEEINADPTAAAAYGYQFWMAGMLNVGPDTKSVFQKIVDAISKVLGIVREHQQAEQILTAFTEGRLRARAAGEGTFVVETRVNENALHKLRNALEPAAAAVLPMVSQLLSAGDWQIRALRNARLTQFADLIHPRAGSEHTGNTMLEARTLKIGEFIKQLNEIFRVKPGSTLDVTGRVPLAPGQDKLHAARVLEVLQDPAKEQRATDQELQTVREVRALLRRMRGYLTEAGVELGDRGETYFPRVYDADVLTRDRVAFIDKIAQAKYDEHLMQVGNKPGTKNTQKKPMTPASRKEAAERIWETLQNNSGYGDVDPGQQINSYTPYFGSANQRSLAWIEAADAAPFLSKDLGTTMARYIEQGVKRAEYTRRFGADGAKFEALLAKAKATGASAPDLTRARKYMQSVMGTLGADLDPRWQRAQGAIMVYQNLRLLALATLTSLADVMGLAVRGDLTTMFAGFKAGFAELRAKAKGDPTELRELGELLGVVDTLLTNEALSYEYGGNFLSGRARKLNEGFFKYIGLQKWTRATRLMALAGAKSFLEKHADGQRSRHSKRFLAQLNLKPADVVLDNGKLKLLSDMERAALEATTVESAGQRFDKEPDELTEHQVELARDDRIRAALNRWVNEAILRPNAAQRPIWASDPRWMLVWHLKGFMYAFQDRILHRVVTELGHGNAWPAVYLTGFVPLMLGADVLRDALKESLDSDDEEADYKAGWDWDDHVRNAVRRAGLTGIGELGLNARQEVQYGGRGYMDALGPTLQQLARSPRLFAEDDATRWRTFEAALPASNLIKDWDLFGT